jgi:hypothetical protein
MNMKTIQAQVNPRLLTKASRLFTGSLSGRIIEILQNARRAGATNVEIINKDSYVTVRDNGRGIADFAQGCSIWAGSGWEDTFEESEDPAGVGTILSRAARSIGSVPGFDGLHRRRRLDRATHRDSGGSGADRRHVAAVPG